MLKGFVLGVAVTILAILAGGYAFIASGSIPANADAKPSKFERWAANKSLGATIRKAPKLTPPIPASPENLMAGFKIYAAQCAVCHSAADAKRSPVSQGLYERPPQFAKYGVEDDPEGETYWVVQHGIRLTGMPSYGASLSQDQIWQVTLFLKHMNELPPAVAAAWKKLPSQAYHQEKKP